MKIGIQIVFLLLLLSAHCIGYSQDSTAVLTTPNEPDTLVLVKEKDHSVRKATILSAVIPGAGQAYNQKYWKMPIVYGGMGACIYFITWNTKEYKFYRDGLVAELDGDPATTNTTGFNTNALSQGMEQHRKWLDISWMSLAGVYVLQILDANVDAHLFYFDVGDDLSFHFHPSLIPSYRVKPGLTLTMKF